MKRLNSKWAFTVATLFFVFTSSDANAGIEWPSFQSGLWASPSNSPIKSSFPANILIVEPSTEVETGKRIFSGVWEGWMCRKKVFDVKLAVENVTNIGATIIYVGASENIAPFVQRLEAKFVDGDLIATTNGDRTLTFALRSDGNMNVRTQRNQQIDQWCTGVLSKSKTPDVQAEKQRGLFFGDNLEAYVTDNPDKKRVRASLADFQRALLAADESSLRGMVSEGFKQIEVIQGKALPALDRTQAFDFENHARQYKTIEFNLKSVTKGVPGGGITATVAASYHGEYFTERFLETYFYRFDASGGKLRRQTRARFSVANPKLLDVQIYVRRQVSKNAIKDAFSSPAVDAKLDKILRSSYDKFPNWEDVSVVFVFREPPRIGSIVRTNIGSQSFDYNVTTADPHLLIENQAKFYFGNSRLPISVFVDNELVAFRSMTH